MNEKVKWPRGVSGQESVRRWRLLVFSLRASLLIYVLVGAVAFSYTEH